MLRSLSNLRKNKVITTIRKSNQRRFTKSVIDNPDKYNWNGLSRNPDFKLEELIKHPNLSWEQLSINPNLTIDFVIQYQEELYFDDVSANPAITWDDIVNNPDLPWEWDYVIRNPNTA